MMSVESILNGVEDTLYIPLVGRIYATKKFPEYNTFNTDFCFGCLSVFCKW